MAQVRITFNQPWDGQEKVSEGRLIGASEAGSDSRWDVVIVEEQLPGGRAHCLIPVDYITDWVKL